jgi:hypothetical protein
MASLTRSAYEGSFTELADNRKIHGYCNIPRVYSKNSKLSKWVTNVMGKMSSMTQFRIQALESLGFD